MVKFNHETHYVVTDKIISYLNTPEEKKPKTAEQIKISFANADESKTKVKEYDAWTNRKPGGKTTYYDVSGNELGSIIVWQRGNQVVKKIHTPDIDYYDNDNNGTIDMKFINKIYVKGNDTAEKQHVLNFSYCNK